jgi:hypothetical protein
MFKTKIDPESIKTKLQGAPILVTYSEYVKYISALYNYCHANQETYKEAFDRAINNEIDYLILQKAVARTDNQIQNDMVFEILVTISTLQSLGAEFTEIKNKDKFLKETNKGVENYLGIINTDRTSLEKNSNVNSLSFFIPRNLNKNFTAIDHKKILNAERMNKTNYNSFPWPYFLLEWLIFLFKQSRKVFKNSSNETMLVRYIDIWIVKLTKLLLSRKKAKCMRITELLTGKRKDLLGNDYNLEKTSMDEIETTDCDKFSVIRKIRCKRLVDARKKLNSSFDSNCNIKVDTRRLGGKKKARRRRRRTKKRDGGEQNYPYFALWIAIIITGCTLLGLGHATSYTINPAHPLVLAGFILCMIAVAMLFGA